MAGFLFSDDLDIFLMIILACNFSHFRAIFTSNKWMKNHLPNMSPPSWSFFSELDWNLQTRWNVSDNPSSRDIFSSSSGIVHQAKIWFSLKNWTSGKTREHANNWIKCSWSCLMADTECSSLVLCSSWTLKQCKQRVQTNKRMLYTHSNPEKIYTVFFFFSNCAIYPQTQMMFPLADWVESFKTVGVRDAFDKVVWRQLHLNYFAYWAC